jgi:hypothetical protein
VAFEAGAGFLSQFQPGFLQTRRYAEAITGWLGGCVRGPGAIVGLWLQYESELAERDPWLRQ